MSSQQENKMPQVVNPYELCARISSLEERLINATDTITENQKAMANDVSKIREAVYNPDVGLYARLRIIETEKKNNAKMLWLILSMAVGSVGAYVVSLLT